MNHSDPILPGISGSIISAVTSVTFLGIGLIETHPVVSDIAVIVSLTSAAFSICASAVTIYKNVRR